MIFMEAIEVVARFDHQGRVIPQRFIWQEITYPVDSIGPRWVDELDQHILVMVPGGKVFELVFVPLDERWYLGGAGERRTIA